jgi:arylsulfatase A-like enzyme/Tfp pilus assembly protein PilF
MLLALILIAIGIGTYGLGWLVQSNLGEGITREVMPQLESADRIEASTGALRGFNVLIITTDTTRADHIGCYGNQSVKTPVLDGLARDGILCAQAITPSPSTLPAHSSLMTGLYPVHHGARSNGTFRLDEKVTTLAERLKAKGYRTGAAISAFVLDSRFGLDQGFDLYHDDLTKGMKYSPHMFRERAAELTNEPVTQWLSENADQPFFLWVHYFDPHAVYLPPDPFRTEYADDLYDGEIAYADSQIGVLLAQLELLGVRDRTLVVYTADHGEGMGEHGEETHSLLVYDATLHVPMIFHAPSGLPKGKVIHRQTSLVDVVPTVLALLGQELPEGLDGANLCDPPPTAPRPILIETIATQAMHGWAPLVGVRRSDYKYILAPAPELYDLARDPRELDNIHEREPDVRRQLTGELVRWLGDDPYLAARRAVDLSQLNVDKESLRKLSALGYVASAPSPTKPSEALRDPKEMIHRWELIQKGINLQAEGRVKEAIPILEQCVADVAGDVFTRGVLAGCYRQLGELDRAMAQFQLAAELGDNSAQVRLGMANVHLARQEFDDAEKEIAAALQIEPENAHAYVLRGQMAYARGQEEEAMELYRKAIEMDPGSVGPSAYNQIGFVHLRAGRLADARDAFRNAIRIDALEGTAHDGLANILYLEGKVDQAMAELQLALRFNPNQPRALATLASLTSQQGDQQKALQLCLRALELAPKLAAAHNNLGLIYRRQGKLDLAEKHYQHALEEDPRLDEAHVNLAQLYSRQGKTDQSLEQFRLAVQKNPLNPNPTALANLGVYHFNQGEFDKAYRFYRRALELHPDYALVHKYMASIYALPEWDRPELAAFHLRRSLELDPGQPEASQMRDLMARAQEEAARRSASASQEPSPTRTETDSPGDKPVPVRPTATSGTGGYEAN